MFSGTPEARLKIALSCQRSTRRDIDMPDLDPLAVHSLRHGHRAFAIEPLRKRGREALRHMLGNQRRWAILRQLHQQRL